MTDHAARMARILERHQDVVHVSGSSQALIKRDELLVLNTHADAVHEQARQWVDSREDFDDLGVTRLRLRSGAGVDAADLTHSLRGGAGAHRRTSVTPNHVLQSNPDWSGGPFDAPTPTEALPAPVAGEASARRVTVGILDTGIDRHPWFHGAAWYQGCTGAEHEVLDPTLADLESDSGHGTFIAGVILQHAPNTYLRVERVLGADGVTDELQVLRGMARMQARAATDADRLDVLNLSLGCFTFDDRPSPVLADAFARAARHSVIVAAAGNHASDRPYWPAALKDVVAVAALTGPEAGGEVERASFSNYGWWVDAAAPGVKIASSFLTRGQENGDQFHGYAKWSGTSFAAPFVAGKIAALMSAKDMTARDAVNELLDSAVVRIPDLGAVVSSAGR